MNDKGRWSVEIKLNPPTGPLKVLIAAILLVSTGLASAEIVVHQNVDYLEDVAYDDDRDLLDIYMPDGAENVPVTVFFHGGALRMGSKAQGELVAERLIPRGIGLVSANYRLSPTFMHPAHIEDAAAATAWVIANIGRYGGDPGKVFVAGHSAGGYLAALLEIDPGYLSAHGKSKSSIRGAIPISPFLYVEETAADRPKDVWGADPVDWLAASVTPHIRAGKGPMLLIYADGDADWRRAQNDRFGEAMREAGNYDVQVIEVPNRDHMSLISKIMDNDDQITDLMTSFIKER